MSLGSRFSEKEGKPLHCPEYLNDEEMDGVYAGGSSMSFLPVILFTLGVIVLIGAWRLGNPSRTSPELLAALKGIAGVKRDIGYIRAELQETEFRLEDHERRIEERKLEERNVVLTSESRKEFEQDLSNRIREQVQEVQKVQEAPLISVLDHTPESASEAVTERTRRSNPRSLSEKYLWVLELHQQGWSTLEIAGHLAISQDAVNMVLKTYPRGVQR